MLKIKKINRPNNPYSKNWKKYWEQNPNLHRGVGADAAKDDGGDEPTIEDLQSNIVKMQDSVAQLTALNEMLTEDNSKWKAKQSDAEKHRKEKEREAAAAVEEAARKSGDVKALEESWNTKYTTDTSALNDKVTELGGLLHGATVTNDALLMATSIAADPKYIPIIQREIEDNLTMEIVNGKPVTKVIENGKPSALTLKDLKEKISNLPMFEDIAKGSDADGNGGAGNPDGTGVATKVKRAVFDSWTQAQRSEFSKKGGKIV